MKITIIYNPNSTGDSKSNAEEAREQLQSAHDVQLVATNFARHAETLAREIADRGERQMIISSSGDGGFHEVINGVSSSSHSDKTITGLLPSGNANDFYRQMHRGSLLNRLEANDIDTIDVLKLTSGSTTIYAHSYIGFGVSAHIGEQLNKTKLNPINEKWLVIRHFFDSSAVKIRYGAKSYRYDNLLFSNVKEMSKVLSISQQAKNNDGLFEITTQKAGNLTGLIGQVLKAATVGLDQESQARSRSFTLLQTTNVQLDGEVYELKKGSDVLIESVSRKLNCII